jgi:hypothetical protein
VSRAPSVKVPDESAPGDSTATKSETKEVTIGGFKFTVPADWEQQPPKSTVLLGEFSIPGDAGPARLTLSSATGGVEANLERWRGQFRPGPTDPEPRETSITFSGKEGTLLELTGTYTDMFSGGSPSRGWKMLGVAVPFGDTNFFVKMTGPASTATARKDEFIKFVESAQMVK